jgi:predicted nucleic-acid-binding protein
MRAVDTNVLVRVIVQDDPRQTDAAKLFVQSGIWVSTLVLAETVWVLESNYGHGRREIDQAVGMMLDLPNVILQDADAVRGALELFRARPGIDFSDCLILALARNAGHLPLGTFDRALSRVTGTELLGRQWRD